MEVSLLYIPNLACAPATDPVQYTPSLSSVTVFGTQTGIKLQVPRVDAMLLVELAGAEYHFPLDHVLKLSPAAGLGYLEILKLPIGDPSERSPDIYVTGTVIIELATVGVPDILNSKYADGSEISLK